MRDGQRPAAAAARFSNDRLPTDVGLRTRRRFQGARPPYRNHTWASIQLGRRQSLDELIQEARKTSRFHAGSSAPVRPRLLVCEGMQLINDNRLSTFDIRLSRKSGRPGSELLDFLTRMSLMKEILMELGRSRLSRGIELLAQLSHLSIAVSPPLKNC